MKEINPDKLRERLLAIYEDALRDSESKENLARAKEMDGHWSGDFLFSTDIQNALNSLTHIYIEPRLNEERLRQIIGRLRDNL